MNKEENLLTTFGLDWRMFVFQLINFIIVGLVLWFMILKPLVKKLAERQAMIDESLDNSKKTQDALARADEDYKEKMHQARLKAEAMLEAATTEAGKLSDELRAKAKQEIEMLVKQAKHNIQIEKEEMMAGLKQETANLIVMALEKLINEKLTADKDKKLIAEIVDKLKS